MMKKVMYIVSILLSLWLIYLAGMTFLTGAFSFGSWTISTADHLLGLDFEWQGGLLIIYSICFICNMKWIHKRIYISLPLVILFSANLIILTRFDLYPSYLYIQLALLIVIYIINICFVNGKEKAQA